MIDKMATKPQENECEIPVIDILKLVSGSKNKCEINKTISKMSSALLHYSTFYVINHGVDASFLKKFFDSAQRFFNLPSEKKDEIHKGQGFRGYFRLNEENTTVDNVKLCDYKEGIIYFNNFKVQEGRPEEIFCKDNPWPKKEYVPDFEATMTEFMDTMLVLGANLLKALAVSLGLPDEYFIKEFTSDPFEALALLHYFPCQQKSGATEVVGVGEHTDYGGITMLLQDDVGGLEVKLPDGRWVPIKYVPDSFIVMIGNALCTMTGGVYPATVHRVLAPEAKHRYSSGLFYDPGVDCIVQPAPIDYAAFSRDEPTSDSSYRYGEYVYGKYVSIFSEEK